MGGLFVVIMRPRVGESDPLVINYSLPPDRAAATRAKIDDYVGDLPNFVDMQVNRVSVDASARNLGVGSKLMMAAEGWAREKGATRMHLVTGNEVASKFYIKLNYKTVGFMGMVHEKELDK